MFDNAYKTVEKEQNSWAYMTFLLPSHCPNDVSGDMQEDEITGGALSLNLLTTQTMVTTGIFPYKEKSPWHISLQGKIPMVFFPTRKNPHSRTGNRTRDLMVSSQRP